MPLHLRLLVVTLLLFAPHSVVQAQPGAATVRIGWISAGSPVTYASRIAEFRQGMRELGHADVFIEQRWAESREELLDELAADLVRQKPTVIVAIGTPASLAMKKATSAIPVVMIAVGDPVASGLVASLGRPGGNLTGVSNLAADLIGKQLELLHSAVPRLGRVAVLMNPANPVHRVYWGESETAAQRLGIKLVRVDTRTADGLEAALAAAARQQSGGVIVPPDPLFLIARHRIAELAAKHRLPTVYVNRGYVEAGGLMSYGPSTSALYRRATVFVDRILKGAKPGELPVEQPATFELILNVKAANTLGLTFPPELLVRADQVIE